MRVKRRFSTRWGHPYHLQGACAKCRQTLLCPLCFIPSMIPESYMEWSAQSKGEDPSDETTVQSEVIKRVKGGTVRHFTRFVLVGMLVGLGMSAPNAVG